MGGGEEPKKNERNLPRGERPGPELPMAITEFLARTGSTPDEEIALSLERLFTSSLSLSFF